MMNNWFVIIGSIILVIFCSLIENSMYNFFDNLLPKEEKLYTEQNENFDYKKQKEIKNTNANNNVATNAKEVKKTSNQIDFSDYMKEMQISIKSHWHPPKSYKNTKVVTFFSIGRSGELINPKIIISSNNIDMDNAAISALKQTAPFKPLPQNFKDNYVDVQFTFDYTVNKIPSNTTNVETYNENDGKIIPIPTI